MISAFLPQLPYNLHYGFYVFNRQAGLCLGYLYFCVHIRTTKTYGNHPVQQGILGVVDAGVLHGITGEDGPKLWVHGLIGVTSRIMAGHTKKLLFQNTEKDVVGLWPGAVKLIV